MAYCWEPITCGVHVIQYAIVVHQGYYHSGIDCLHDHGWLIKRRMSEYYLLTENPT